MNMMNNLLDKNAGQLVSAERLRKADKILFVAHLALGDYTYMEACFNAFQASYPHVKIDIWVDELRRTNDFRKWQSLRKYALFDWLEESPYFHKIYKNTYSTFSLLRSLIEARRQRYPIVVSFGLSRRTFYAKLVARIAPAAFIVAIGKPYKPYDLIKRRIFERLDGRLQDYPPGAAHVSEIYAAWFKQLFGLNISAEQRMPQLSVPKQWIDESQHYLHRWNIDAKSVRSKPLVFVNAFSKQDERSWSVDKALDLIVAMQADASWHHCHFIVNTVPEKWHETEVVLASRKLGPTVSLFSASDNFFQLPAILSQCDLIISVETAVMHLANAVNVPVIALMRQLTPEWVPIDTKNSRVVMTTNRDDWVQKIEIERVIAALPDPVHMQWDSDSVSI